MMENFKSMIFQETKEGFKNFWHRTNLPISQNLVVFLLRTFTTSWNATSLVGKDLYAVAVFYKA
jgi:hypothetical protein